MRNVVLYIQGEGGEAPKRTVIITHGAAGGSVYETAASDDVALTGYDPGVSIPCTRSVSPSGGMTYNVPIATAAGLKNVPQLSLAYNSQGGEGLAGYGWDLSGLSAITVTNKTVYYDGGMYAADADSEYAVYSLDGVRLVPNSIANLSNTWQYETASGHVIVKKHTDAQGRALWFEAMYPNGSRATFGNSTATSPSVVYPVTLSRDRDGNWVRYSYASDPETDDIHLQRIEYGVAGNSQVQASIGLEYASRADWHTRYMCGRTFGHSVMLKSVSSLNGADTLRKYTLVHEMREGANLLRRIRMSTPSTTAGQPAREAVPLRFGYGDTGFVPAVKLEGGRELFFEDVFSPDDELVYIRGKFVPGSYSDGVLIYAKTEDNEVDTVPFCFVPSLDRTSDTKTGEMDAHYNVLEAIDVDGDGLDEIVVLKAIGSRMFCFVLGVDEEGNLYINNQFNAGSAISNALYQYGAYYGRGCVQMLAIIITQNIHGEYTGEYRLIDIAGGTYSSGTFFSDITDYSYPFFTADLDGDGVSEVCRLTASGLDIWRASSNGQFSKVKTITGITSSNLNYGKEMLLSDLNADRYMDIVLAPRKGYPDTWFAYLFDGRNFHATSWQGPLRVASGKDMFMDVDHDGLPDLVSVKKERLCVFLNEKGKIGRTYMEIDAPGLTAEGLIPCNVARFGAASTLMMFDEGYVKEYKVNIPMPERRHLRRFTGSTNVRQETEYGYAAENVGYEPMPEYVPDADSGFFRMSFPGYVVRTDRAKISRTDPDSKRIESKMYSYAGATFNTRGLGFCGFRRTKTEDLLHPDTLTAVAVFNPEKRGVPVADSTFVGGTLIADRIYTYDSNYTTYGKLNPRLTRSVESDHLTGITVGNNYTYGSYDLPVMVATSRSVNGGDGTVDVTTTQYTNSINSYQYILGIPTTVTETKGLLASKTEVTLNESMLPSRTRTYSGTVSSGSTQWHLVSDRIILYDECGNAVSDKTAAYGATTYNETTYSYDAAGRYIRSETDPLGRTTTYDLYSDYGQPVTVYDRLAHETDYGYDAWGRLTYQFLPDGTDEYITYAWSASGEPGLYCVSKTVTGQPDTKVWYDALGREVRNANKRFDGGWQYVTTEYDGRGQLYRTSLPYKNVATGPTLWNTYTYDNYNRPISLSEASGNQTTWSYSGTNTTTTKDGMTSTSSTDAEGNVVSVSDAGGTITYTLRDDGQPSSVTVTPDGTNQNIVTSFTYDAYGRRTAIIDPSAGTRSDTYTDNADGTSSIAHTGPNGTVTSYYDRFGRVTSVTRPEFNTSYTYGTTLYDSNYGKLLSETSTNGTSRSFTYDGYGRPITETEHADSTNWLRRTYTYGAGSNVASINYTTQDGFITTENYSYANGHNTSISATGSGNTTFNVFTLTSENVLGQPTAVTTGGATRNYGYTSAGIPSMRQISDTESTTVQNFSYTYAPTSGNMLSRSDNVMGIQESFNYDTQNRLLGATESWNEWTPMEFVYENAATSFNSKGNITTRTYDGLLSLDITYDNSTNPYEATSASEGSTMEGGYSYPMMGPSITTTSFDRPASVSLGSETPYLAYKYNASGEKAKMTMNDNGYGVHMNRYYLGGVYEKDENTGDSITQRAERLFLGGTAYDAPMVLVKSPDVNEGVWTPFNIGRDVQGSITEVLTADGEIVERFRYDPWGVQLAEVAIDTCGVEAVDSLEVILDPVMVDTLAVPEPWQMAGLSVYVGSHGYTGHEHIYGLGLINCNARLYDPAIGRFLAPDPLIQDPASTQNFNRYSYCLNNPLKYTDESGEFAFSTMLIVAGVSAVLFGAGNTIAHNIRGDINDLSDGFRYFAQGFLAGAAVGATLYFAWSIGPVVQERMISLGCFHVFTTGASIIRGFGDNGWAGLEVPAKNLLGLFYLDENDFWEGVKQGYLRHTLEFLQTGLGYDYTQFRNFFDPVDRVDYLGGATFVTKENSKNEQGVTIGNYANMDIFGQIGTVSFDEYVKNKPLYMHEYGHTIDSRRYGLAYLFYVGGPSLMSAALSTSSSETSPTTGLSFKRYTHDVFRTETSANRNASTYFSEHYGVSWSTRYRNGTIEDYYPL